MRRFPAGRRAPRTASSRSWSAATPTSTRAPSRVLAHYARAVTLMGGPGSGQLTKMVNQICVAGVVQGLAEGIDFAMRAGLDPRARHRRDQQGRRAVVADGEPREDDDRRQVRLRLRRRLDAQGPRHLPRGSAAQRRDAAGHLRSIDQFYARVQQLGGGRWDTSSLLRVPAAGEVSERDRGSARALIVAGVALCGADRDAPKSSSQNGWLRPAVRGPAGGDGLRRHRIDRAAQARRRDARRSRRVRSSCSSIRRGRDGRARRS